MVSDLPLVVLSFWLASQLLVLATGAVIEAVYQNYSSGFLLLDSASTCFYFLRGIKDVIQCGGGGMRTGQV